MGQLVVHGATYPLFAAYIEQSSVRYSLGLVLYMCHITSSIELLCAGGHGGPPLRGELVHVGATLHIDNTTDNNPNRIKPGSNAMRGGMWSGRASRRTQVRVSR